MKFLRSILDKQAPMFEKGGKLERLYPLHEAGDTFLFTPGHKTHSGPHARDAIDLKRTMIMVVIALVPCTLMAFYNTGLQAQTALAEGTAGVQVHSALAAWILGLFNFETGSLGAILLHGFALFLPMYVISMAIGGIAEAIFCIIRKHEINEGFLVSGLLFPLVLPPTLPLWQAALGILFGVILGKEVFGGTGYNILNPALTARCFVFFAYPAEMSGDAVWVGVDGLLQATPLAEFAATGATTFSWFDCFVGVQPGSMGETSTLACLIGAGVLLFTKVGSWRIMLSCLLGMIGMTLFLNIVASDTNPFMAVPFWWHLVTGGFAFGLVFMATDPVSAPNTEIAKYYYGALIGVLCVLVRVINPAYPEGMMLAILFMNVFAPLIDHFVVKANIKRRKMRVAVQQ